MDKEVAIVIGASRGIGRAIAQKLSEQSITVVVNYLINKQMAEEVVESIKQNRKLAHSMETTSNQTIQNKWTLEEEYHFSLLKENEV
ncbi:SDR family NAD(P)-dependent oxidoreductase [Bacillus sp. 165]|uniref:SDR family NAD(P)-dependent oxidoreductase n=1 Tax=Bacillus sp. 165 TaxID=1529117 RepID=UPI001ADB8781|nr:SDR family NAD(P)-dependent oxidoreductase [Bacillus sp. 165]MBO9129515.1 SDR family NAD(P)-dependent oxidoreductase [Bacillus sp. 165]